MLEVKNISFSYEDKTPLLKGVSFSLEKGDHLCVMGESGSGKSTLLKAIYGLIDVQGAIFFGGKKVLGPAFQLVAGAKNMKFVAQDFGLNPYHTVAENVGKFLSNIDLDFKKKRILELLSLVEMEDFANRSPLQLSGGEKQRIALAVALAQEPELLLLDEPFSQIDNFRKNKLQRLLFSYLKEKNIGCVMASHDVTEALSFSDKLLIIKGGEVVCFGQTQEIYHQKTDFYTASLLADVFLLKKDDGTQKTLKSSDFQVVTNSDLEVIVLKNYFQGSQFLVEALLGNQKIYFFSEKMIEIGKKIYLSEKS